MKKKLIFLFVICMMFIPHIDAKEYDNEKLIIDNNIVIDNDINSSSLIMGNSVEVDSKIGGSGVIVGNDISLNSTADYLVALGTNITYSGKTTDALMVANKIVLNESSNISRDITMFASTVEVSGSINRNITIYAKEVIIKDAQIAGNVKIVADTITIEANAAIIGRLSHNDDAKITISDVASIGSVDTFVSEKHHPETFLDKVKNSVIGMVNILVVFALLTFFSPKLFNKIDEKRKEIIKNIGLGFIFLLLLPIIILMLIITVFGLSLGVILIAIYLLMVYLSSMITGYLIGSFIWDKLIKKEKRIYLTGVIGILILYTLKLIPVVGIIITVISIMIGVGTIISLYNRKKV